MTQDRAHDARRDAAPQDADPAGEREGAADAKPGASDAAPPVAPSEASSEGSTGGVAAADAREETDACDAREGTDAADPLAGPPPSRTVQRPARFDGRAWWRVTRRGLADLVRQNYTLIAAGTAFYSALALAPALAALGALYGFFADPAAMADHLDIVEELAPPAAYRLIADQVAVLETAGRSTLGWTSFGAAAFAVWTSRAGVRTLMMGVSTAYRQEEGRGVVMTQIATILLTCLFIVLAVIALALVVAAPPAIALLPFGDLTQWLASLARWPIVLGVVMLGLGALYRFGPSRRLARTEWVSPGTVAALALWLAGSIAFSLYVTNVAAYSETYGALGAVAGLLIWFWLSAFSALVGAVLNAQLELETAADTTIGPDRPMGARRAFVADNLAD
jgi:membrane protein